MKQTLRAMSRRAGSTGRAARVVALAALVFATPAVAQVPADTLPSTVRRAASNHPEPGDRVWLHVWKEPKMSDTIQVDENGQVQFPKIGLIGASTMTISAFRDTVRSRFGEFLRDSPIDIVVLRRIAVNGEVNKPDVYYMDVSMTLRDAIARAGGITENGSPNKVAIVRGTQKIPVRDWQENQSVMSDLQSGDQVVVGRKAWLSINALAAISVSTVVASLVISLAHR